MLWFRFVLDPYLDPEWPKSLKSNSGSGSRAEIITPLMPTLLSLQILFTAISLCAPIASGLAMAFPVFALTVYQDSGGRNPDNPLVRPLDTEQGSWFGQHPKTANLPLPLISPWNEPKVDRDSFSLDRQSRQSPESIALDTLARYFECGWAGHGMTKTLIGWNLKIILGILLTDGINWTAITTTNDISQHHFNFNYRPIRIFLVPYPALPC